MEYVIKTHNCELYHHGVLGQKWGVRRYQNKDGSLTAAGKAKIKKTEKKAVNKAYKEYRKNGGHYLFKSVRVSTGKNYDDAITKFKKQMADDKKHKELRDKAHNAEQKRMHLIDNFEKKNSNSSDYDARLEKFLKSEEYMKADKESLMASRANADYLKKKAQAYTDVLKEAKLKDMKITGDFNELKKYVSDKSRDLTIDVSVDDFGNGYIDYNDDYWYYE